MFFKFRKVVYFLIKILQYMLNVRKHYFWLMRLFLLIWVFHILISVCSILGPGNRICDKRLEIESKIRIWNFTKTHSLLWWLRIFKGDLKLLNDTSLWLWDSQKEPYLSDSSQARSRKWAWSTTQTKTLQVTLVDDKLWDLKNLLSFGIKYSSKTTNSGQWNSQQDQWNYYSSLDSKIVEHLPTHSHTHTLLWKYAYEIWCIAEKNEALITQTLKGRHSHSSVLKEFVLSTTPHPYPS